MLNFIFNQRGNVKINQLLNQEEGCTIEELLNEEERLVVLCRGGSQPKLIEFICQKATLQQLIQYAVKYPRNPNNHDQTKKFPYFAADVLSCNAMIMEALIEGGWSKDQDEEDSNDKGVNEDLEETENSLVQSILKGSGQDETKQQLVDTLDQDLEIDGDDQGTAISDEQKEKTATSVGLKQNILDANKKDVDDDDDEVNLEEVKDEEETADATVDQSPTKKDHPLLDMLCSFLYEDEEPLSILCGYFSKIMEQMLDKQKQLTLEYLLIHQEGQIFNGLLRHLDHHSLTTLMIKLVEQQIQPEKKDKWEASDNSDDEAEPELTADQTKMQVILKEKADMVVSSLIEKLSSENDDLHMTLNAHQALIDFSENESFFQVLIQPEMICRIVKVVCTTDANMQNQPYALNFLTQLINQFTEQDISFFKEGKDEAMDTLLVHFQDLVYNSLLILRGGDLSDTFRNQSNSTLPKTGMLRIRAMEQLRALVNVVARRAPLREQTCLNDTLRKKIIETIFYMTRTFQFCSISHQQGLLILNLMREAFDETDLETMKTFVRTELENDKDFHFQSGRRCSRANIGQIVKIAFELRNITQKALDDMDSDDDEDAATQESIEKRSEMQSWFHFCNNEVAAIEKIWNQKLDKSEPKPTAAPIDTSGLDGHEQAIEEMLAKLKFSGKNRFSRTRSAENTSEPDAAMVADIQADREKQESKDDSFNGKKKTGEFGDNQFWKAAEHYDIDDLLAELNDP